MKLTWLGQAGYLCKTDSLTVMIDPYLTDSLGELDPEKHRSFPVPEPVFSERPDVMIFTHCHADHYDPGTVRHFLTRNSRVTVLAPRSVWDTVRKAGGRNNYVLFGRHTVWTEGNVMFRAVRAEHSDPHAIGVVITEGKRRYYFTGDTLYNEDIFPDLPQDIHAVFLPVNGAGNNMNPADAARFALRIGARYTVPMHYGLFDTIRAEELDLPAKRMLRPFEETEF